MRGDRVPGPAALVPGSQVAVPGSHEPERDSERSRHGDENSVVLAHSSRGRPERAAVLQSVSSLCPL